VKDILKDLGLDPLKDIDSVIAGFPAAKDKDADKPFVVVTGRFNQDKIESKAIELAKDQPNLVKSYKEGAYKLFEISPPNQPQSMYAAVADKNLLLAASTKAALIEALDKNAGKKTSKLKNKELAAAVAKVDAKQSIWVVVPASSLPESMLSNKDLKDIVADVDIITAGVTVTDKINIKVGVSTKTADAAKKLQKKIKSGLQLGQVLVLNLGDQYAPLSDAINAVKTTANDKTLTIEAELSAELIEKLSKLAEGAGG
jgi:hypothetical protein